VKREVDEGLAEEARGTLKGHVVSAAKDWRTASGIAAQKGDHRPAKDLLLSARAIERVCDSSGTQVTVVVGMPGRPAMPAPSQAEIDAAVLQQTARRAGVTIDGVSRSRLSFRADRSTLGD